MTTIRANCPACGDIQLTATELTVRVCTDDDRGSYWFSCPECERPVTKDASPRIIELLVSSGVRKQAWRLPAELREPHYIGEPITPDDLLDFHLLLARDGWIADLESSLRAGLDR